MRSISSRAPDLLLGVLDVDVGEEEGGVHALEDLLDVLLHAAEVHGLPGLLQLLGQRANSLELIIRTMIFLFAYFFITDSRIVEL